MGCKYEILTPTHFSAQFMRRYNFIIDLDLITVWMKNVDHDQLVSSEASESGSTCF